MRFQLKSVLAAGCLLAASVLSAAAFEATTVEPSELLQGPGEDFEPIVELPAGTIVEVLNCDRSFCEVSVEDYDGFIPREVLDLGGNPVPFYAFPPQIAAPARWHGRYYSRDHYRYESRSRWRDRDGRRLFAVPVRPQPRPLRPIRRDGPRPEFRTKQKQFDQKGPGKDQLRIQRAPDQPRIQRTPDQPRIQRAPDQPRIQRAPDQPRIQRAPDQPRPRIQQQVPVQRQAPPQPQKPQPQPQKKKQDQVR